MRIVLYPVLLVLLPVASLLSTNIESIAIRHSLRAGIIAVVGVVFLLLILKRAFGDWHRAGIVTSAFALLFFTYGYIQDFVVAPFVQMNPEPIARHMPLVTVLVMLLAVLTWSVSRTRINLQSISSFLTVVAVGALVLPLVKIANHELRGLEAWPEGVEKPTAEFTALERTDVLPDIYYIVLDGYGRADVLSEIYDFDNSSFLDFLEDRGFSVGDESSSNYGVTHLSLASSLNLSYLDRLAETMGDDSEDHRAVTTLLKGNLVAQMLRDLGYEVIAIETGYRRTEFYDADVFLRMPARSVTPFEAVLLEHSMARALLDILGGLGLGRWYPGYQAHRDLIHFSLDELVRATTFENPKFIFAHILAPHPPFLFEMDGRNNTPAFPYSIEDGNYFAGSSDEYVTGYRKQVSYLNSQLSEVVSKIIAFSEVPPIIVLQGDHGPGLMVNWDDATETNLFERMSILNAILISGFDGDQISQSISPVNTFRLIFNEQFGADFELLDNKSYFSSWRRPYEFVEAPLSE